MNLNDIQLTKPLMADLYGRNLVAPGKSETGPPATAVKPEKEPVAGKEKPVPKNLRYLGENKKQIIILVNYAEHPWLPDQHLELLTNMLTACQLGISDIALINTSGKLRFSDIADISCKQAILFGISPEELGLPLRFPMFQLQPFNKISFLYSPSLDELQNDNVLKSKLWVTLRRMFSI